MKTIKSIILIMSLILTVTSCTDDPLAYIYENGDEWNNERGIKGLVVEGQIGKAAIVNTVDESTVSIKINPEAVSDWSQIKVNYIGLSWRASSDIQEGSTLDLSNTGKTATIVVTSQTGQTREWTVIAEEFVNPVSGSWSIRTYKYSYDDYYGWGNSGYDVDVDLKLTPSAPGLDDIITFGTVEDVYEGMPYGPYSRTAGDNGAFASYVYNDIHDFTPMFGQLPAGEGTYYLTENGNGETVIKIVMDSGESYTTSVVTITSDTRIKIQLLPTMRDLTRIDWDNYYAPFTSFVSCVDLYYTLVKL